MCVCVFARVCVCILVSECLRYSIFVLFPYPVEGDNKYVVVNIVSVFVIFTADFVVRVEVGVGGLRRCQGIVWERIRKRAHAQLVRKHWATVVSVR